MGAYAPGHDPLLDRALARRAEMELFLAQPEGGPQPFERAVAALIDGWKPA